MSDQDGAPRRRMTRCPEGHIFDGAAHDACPSCGARPAAAQAEPVPQPKPVEPPPAPAPSPQPGWLRPALIGAGALVLALIVALMFRGATPSAPSQIAAKPEEHSTGGLAVERWRTVMVIGGRSYDCINETTSDGRYRLGDGCPAPFAGETGQTTVNADGTWSSRSDAGRTDSGRIEVISEDKFIAHTRGGPVVWERVKPER